MKHKHIFSSLLILISFLFINIGCKKSSASNSSSSGSTTSTNNSYTLDTKGNPSGTYSGFLLNYADIEGASTTNTGFSEFFNSPTASTGFDTASLVSVTSVSMNNIYFSYYSVTKQYSDTTNSLNFPPAKWIVGGLNSIPSFTYTNNNSIPVYTGQSQLPNSVIRSQNLTIPVSGVSNYDQIEIQIQDNMGNMTSQSVSNTTSSITFLKDSLSKLSSGSNASIMVILAKYNPQTFSGKSFLFATAKYYTQGLTLN